jgi:glycosyltransferase involved in cell wall biosynthesis
MRFMPKGNKMEIDLAVVMPVYNEEECIVDVVESWLSALSELNIEFRIFVLNDGSSDGTQQALQVFHHDNRIEVINKVNSGHGPTILMGYKKSVKLADWTFQCDSDDEMKPDSFRTLWENRERFDALFGIRIKQNQNFARRLISACSRIIVRILFGRGITDVNTPYRLVRSEVLERIIQYIPVDAFAPNVIISGIICKFGFSVFEHPVFHENRITGKVSIVRWKLWKSAAKAFWQTLLCWAAIKDISYQSA